MAVTHSKVSAAADTSNTTNVRPSDWNADHLGTNVHDHTDSDSGDTIDHTDLTSIGTNTHAQIDTFITNPMAGSAIMTTTSGSVIRHDVSTITAGSYASVIVDTYGHVTGGSEVATYDTNQEAVIVANSASIVAIETAGSAQDTLISWNSGSISGNGSLIGYNTGSIVALQIASVVSGSQIATLADVDGSAIDLLTGTTGIAGFIVNGYVSGSNINNFKVANSGSNLLITSASAGYIISVNDVYNWIVF